MKSLFPESFVLLDERRFSDLETHLDNALDRVRDRPFGRHVPLMELANCGAKRYSHLEEWAQKYPESGYAHCVISAYWANCASTWRGAQTSVPEQSAVATIYAADLAARWGVSGLLNARDKIYAYNLLYELDLFLGLPLWVRDDTKSETFAPDMSTLKLLADAGYTCVPDIPNLPWPKGAEPSDWLKEQAWEVRPDAYLLALTEMHFCRPRWGGSLEAMQALLDTPRYKAQPEPQRALMKIWIDTDSVDGFVPYNADPQTSREIEDQFDAAL